MDMQRQTRGTVWSLWEVLHSFTLSLKLFLKLLILESGVYISQINGWENGDDAAYNSDARDQFHRSSFLISSIHSCFYKIFQIDL